MAAAGRDFNTWRSHQAPALLQHLHGAREAGVLSHFMDVTRRVRPDARPEKAERYLYNFARHAGLRRGEDAPEGFFTRAVEEWGPSAYEVWTNPGEKLALVCQRRSVLLFLPLVDLGITFPPAPGVEKWDFHTFRSLCSQAQPFTLRTND